MNRFSRSLSRAALALAATISFVALPGCETEYRHEVGGGEGYQVSMDGWIRYDGFDQTAGDLQIGYADYNKPGSKVTLKMVGVIHLGDEGYYRHLQSILDDCDVVFYEGVRRGDTPRGEVDPGTKKLWRNLSSLIGLAAQVEVIDYRGEHWRQVDMITDEDDGQGEVQNPLHIFMDGFDTLLEMKQFLAAFVDIDRVQDGIKHAYASSLVQVGDTEGSFKDLARELGEVRRMVQDFSNLLGSDALDQFDRTLATIEENLTHLAEVIIKERNRHVMDVLRENLEAWEAPDQEDRTVAIFYGAGHMGDFDERLAKMGWTRGPRSFLNAWAIDSRGVPLAHRAIHGETQTVELDPAYTVLHEVADGKELVNRRVPKSWISHWIGRDVPFSGEGAAKATLVRFFTDNCRYCQTSLPHIEGLRQKYGPYGLQTAAVYHPKPKGGVLAADVVQWADDMGYYGPLGVDPSWTALERVWLTKENRATSVTILIDASGRIRYIHPGPVLSPDSEEDREGYEHLDQAIRFLLTEH